ncbi:hypothetical protein [Neptuniibacter sp. QD37_11]|uniref:beta-sandwich lipoprotein n=1 Tax=Neptuniibacter sp. QD37_11 TaxID=3398209 RepID=UPI0039F61449
MKRTKIAGFLAVALMTSAVTGCFNQTDAKIAKDNVAAAADNFEVNRRIVFYNTWTDTVMNVIEGLCSIDYDKTNDTRVSVICKVGETSTGEHIVRNNMISKTQNTTVWVEQLDDLPVNVYHYRRTFKPQSVIPDIDFRGNLSSMGQALIPDNND